MGQERGQGPTIRAAAAATTSSSPESRPTVSHLPKQTQTMSTSTSTGGGGGGGGGATSTGGGSSSSAPLTSGPQALEVETADVVKLMLQFCKENRLLHTMRTLQEEAQVRAWVWGGLVVVGGFEAVGLTH